MQDHNERVHSPHICFELWKTHPEPETAWEGHKMILVYYDLLYAPDADACVWSPPPAPAAAAAATYQLALPQLINSLFSPQCNHCSLSLYLATTTYCVQTANTLNIPMLLSLILCF